MAAIGTFPLLQRAGIIYTAPKPAPVPVSTTAPPPPRGVPIPTLTVPKFNPPLAQPFSGGIITTTAPTTSGGTAPTSSGGTTSPTTTGAVSGSGSTGGTDTSGTDTSRLIDLISGAFQPQSVQQPYGPTAVDSGTMTDATTAPATSGTNPMAVVVLAILAIAGVFWYAHRKGKRAA